MLKLEPTLATPSNKALLTSLEAALQPSTAVPGTIEAMIDELVDTHASASSFMSLYDRDPTYTRILHRGFDAVPALIDHLDDGRLTRSVMSGFNKFIPYIRRTNEVVSDLLRDIAGPELDDARYFRNGGRTLDKPAIQAWFEKAKRVGEKDYLLRGSQKYIDRLHATAAQLKEAVVSAELIWS